MFISLASDFVFVSIQSYAHMPVCPYPNVLRVWCWLHIGRRKSFCCAVNKMLEWKKLDPEKGLYRHCDRLLLEIMYKYYAICHTPDREEGNTHTHIYIKKKHDKRKYPKAAYFDWPPEIQCRSSSALIPGADGKTKKPQSIWLEGLTYGYFWKGNV